MRFVKLIRKCFYSSNKLLCATICFSLIFFSLITKLEAKNLMFMNSKYEQGNSFSPRLELDEQNLSNKYNLFKVRDQSLRVSDDSKSSNKFANNNYNNLPSSLIPDLLVIRDNTENTRHLRALNVFGNDDRIDAVEYRYPESTVGKVIFKRENGNYYGCTASLIDRDHILTNAHCVFEESGDKFILSEAWKSSFYFYPYYRKDNVLDRAGWKSIVVSEDYINKGPTYSGQDWAIIRIDKAFGDVFGWLNLAKFKYDDYHNLPNKVNLIGYSGDLYQDKPGAHYDCNIRGVVHYSFGSRLTHDCDSTKGSSGSSLYQIKEDSDKNIFVEVIAVHHANVINSSKNNYNNQRRERYSIFDANLAIETQFAHIGLRQSIASDLEVTPEYKLSGWEGVGVKHPEVVDQLPKNKGNNSTKIIYIKPEEKDFFTTIKPYLPYIISGFAVVSVATSALIIVKMCKKNPATKAIDSPA